MNDELIKQKLNSPKKPSISRQKNSGSKDIELNVPWLQRAKIEEFQGLCRRGLTDKEICKAFGIKFNNMKEFLKQYPIYKEIYETEKLLCDVRVENALYKRAVGFTETETKIVTKADGKVEYTKQEKYFPPDPLSMFYYLKNRVSERWQDKIQGTDNTVTYEDLRPVAELLKISAKELKKHEQKRN